MLDAHGMKRVYGISTCCRFIKYPRAAGCRRTNRGCAKFSRAWYNDAIPRRTSHNLGLCDVLRGIASLYHALEACGSRESASGRVRLRRESQDERSGWTDGSEESQDRHDSRGDEGIYPKSF